MGTMIRAALKINFSNDTVVTVAGALEEQAILTILEGLPKLFLSAAIVDGGNEVHLLRRDALNQTFAFHRGPQHLGGSF